MITEAEILRLISVLEKNRQFKELSKKASVLRVQLLDLMDNEPEDVVAIKLLAEKVKEMFIEEIDFMVRENPEKVWATSLLKQHNDLFMKLVEEI